VVIDLEKNEASAVIYPQQAPPVARKISLNYPSESVFSPDSQLLVCYDGNQLHGDCDVRHLEVIFDARGGDYDPRDLIFGIHRNFLFLSVIK